MLYYSDPELFILRGVPGSGKSHIATALADSGCVNSVICSADHYFMDVDGEYRFDPTKLPDAHKACFENVRAAVERRDGRIVLDNCNVLPEHFAEYEALAARHGYRVYHLVVERRHTGVNQHGVPAERVDLVAEKLAANIKV